MIINDPVSRLRIDMTYFHVVEMSTIGGDKMMFLPFSKTTQIIIII